MAELDGIGEGMPESKKVEEYRKTLHRAAKAGRAKGVAGQAHLEGEAAKLGLEVQAEESKAAPEKQRGNVTDKRR